MSNDILFELGTEELPPQALKKLRDALKSGFEKGLKDVSIDYSSIQAYAAPRRLAIIVKQAVDCQPDVDIEKKGPAVKAAFDADGNPSKAALGFAKSCGTDIDQLDRQQTDKGEWLVYKHTEKGKATTTLLPDIANQALASLPIPKRMRWGNSDVEFVRPVQWLLFLFGNDVVPCTILDASAGNTSCGHRFHAPENITITHADNYLSQLKDTGYVLADFDERREVIRSNVIAQAEKSGGIAVIDEQLLDEVTGLVEWPVAVSGQFDTEFLAVPHEALILSMEKHQKYFHVENKAGDLLPMFITVANIESTDPAQIASGNERVIRPRLADAMFFWDQDGKHTLASLRERLKSVVFQQQLGTVFEKTERIAKLATYIAKQSHGDIKSAQRAGELCKSDLLTEMVNEFADMQGIMGTYQAKRDGENEDIALAMQEVYLPRFAGDTLPATKTGLAISLADKLDTITGIFAIGQKPTGTKDPFALRRAALGILRILIETPSPMDLMALIKQSATIHKPEINAADAVDDVYLYIKERLNAYFSDQSIPPQVIDAVLSVNPTVPADIQKRIVAMNDFIAMEEAESLAAANKRIANILKKQTSDTNHTIDTSLLVDPSEQVLTNAIDTIITDVEKAFANGDYTVALTQLATLKTPVDQFFDNVMVMVEDEKVKNNRLAILAKLKYLFSGAGDLSRLQSK